MEVQDLYAKFYKELLAYCKAMAKSSAAAEDLVQETYLRAFTHWDDVEDLSTSQCRAWLYRTARNLFIDQARKLARETPTEEEQLSLASFEEDLSQAAVAQLIARLPDAERSRIRAAAKTVYRALDCAGFARVDLFYTPDGNIGFNEVNTVPGFTEHSRFPGMMRGAGLEFDALVEKLIEGTVTAACGNR